MPKKTQKNIKTTYFYKHRIRLPEQSQQQQKNEEIQCLNIGEKSYGHSSHEDQEILQEQMIKDLETLKKWKPSTSQHLLAMAEENKIKADENTEATKLIHQQYQELQNQYQSQLKSIKAQTEKLNELCIHEKTKIRLFDTTLSQKRKQLSKLQDNYIRLTQINQTKLEAEERAKNKIVTRLKEELNSIKQNNQEILSELTKQRKALDHQYEELAITWKMLEKEINCIELEDYEGKMNEMKEEEESLLRSIRQLEKQGEKISKEVQKTKSMKPPTLQTHQKYLELYEKMAVLEQLQKAYAIVNRKEEEYNQQLELQSKKQHLQDKKVQVQLKEKKINEENKTIDSLTEQIREKSTALLNMYNSTK